MFAEPYLPLPFDVILTNIRNGICFIIDRNDNNDSNDERVAGV